MKPTTRATRSVILLDLLARADGFVGDENLRQLGSHIEALGARLCMLRTVLERDAGGDLLRWHDRLSEFLRTNPGDVVVLTRVWDAATVDAVRAALPEATLVRLSSGVAARLDERFDHVLDLPGLLALVGGEERPAPAAWAKTTARELRQRGNGLSVIPATADYVVLPGVAEQRRPTITGPATGCPFLLDSRKSAIYRELPVDEGQVQMKGCTFCLDNIGAYAAPSEEAMVGSWLAQLRTIRQRDPAAREVLCTDERPHPYLPALYRALVAEPELAPIELLIKTRVDWLLQFADGALTEALGLARRTGSKLHVYLVGFENFEPFHLELFNKGVTVEDNVRAIGKLRELEARFPDTFEYRKYRAHGIVLFTPWTRPEHLLENARRMREVRFEELRSDALRTRLRLYPRVPLHALAERDGLLTEHFDEGRGDRAAEQGYDASVPWRFQDPRVEAIFQVATHSTLLRQRGYVESDVLAAATRFILRWPGLAAAPEHAVLPFEQALRIWLPPPESGVAPGFDPELDAIAAGAKAASLKEAVPRAQAQGLLAAYHAMGLHAAEVWTHDLAKARDEHREGDAFVMLAVAKDAATLDAVLEAQRTHRQGDREAARVVGGLMGYPPCCIDAFLSQGSRGDNLANERLTFLRAPTQPLHPLLNRFRPVRLVSHHPCTPSCAASVALAEQVLARLSASDPEAAVHILHDLSRAVLVLDYSRRIDLCGTWHDERFLVTEAAPLDDARHLGLALDALHAVRLEPSSVLLEMRDGSTTRLDGARPLLVVPGEPLAAPALATLAADATQHLSPHPGPALPHALRQGARVLGYRIDSVRSVVDGTHLVHYLELQHDDARLVLRLRADQTSRPATLRRAGWAIDVETPGPLTERARAALVLVASALSRPS